MPVADVSAPSPPIVPVAAVPTDTDAAILMTNSTSPHNSAADNMTDPIAGGLETSPRTSQQQQQHSTVATDDWETFGAAVVGEAGKVWAYKDVSFNIFVVCSNWI